MMPWKFCDDISNEIETITSMNMDLKKIVKCTTWSIVLYGAET